MKFKALFAAAILAASAFNLAAQDSGVEYYKAGQLTNAKELLTRSLSQNSTDRSKADYYLGLISIVEKNTNKARQYFDDGIAADAADPYNYVGLGRLSLANNNLKEAETYFKQAEKLAKKDASLDIAIARTYYDIDPVAYSKQIEKYIDKARKADMSNVDIYLFEGDRYYDADDINKAASMYEMGTNYNPQATEAYVKYANLFTKVNPDYAITMLNNLLVNNPNSALGQRELANAYYNKQDFANAAKAYGRYVKNPNHFKQDEDRYAFLLFYGQDYKGGYEYASELLAANPENFSARRYQLMNAAQLPEMASELLPMAEALNQRHLQDPKTNQFASIDYLIIGDTFAKANRAEDAIAVLNEGATELPEFAGNFYKKISETYVDLNNISKAADTFNKYIATLANPGYNDYIQQAVYQFYGSIENRADAALSTQYLDNAAAAAMNAINQNPDGYRSYKVLGDIAKQKAPANQAKSAAVKDYEKAFELLKNSQDPSRYASDVQAIGLYLASYYGENGQKDKARQYVQDVISIVPDSADAAKLLKTL